MTPDETTRARNLLSQSRQFFNEYMDLCQKHSKQFIITGLWLNSTDVEKVTDFNNWLFNEDQHLVFKTEEE